MYKEQTIKKVSLQDKASGAQRSFRCILAGLTRWAKDRGAIRSH